MKKSTIWVIVIIVILVVLGIIVISASKQKVPDEVTPEAEESEIVSQSLEQEEAIDEEFIKTLTELPVPRVGDEPPAEEVGAPEKIASGESSKPEQEYWVFEADLKNSVLDPFEFRIPINDLFGISVTNKDDTEHNIYVSTTASFTPSFIERFISSGKTEFIRIQVLELGKYDIMCSTCENEAIGQFVVVPKK